MLFRADWRLTSYINAITGHFSGFGKVIGRVCVCDLLTMSIWHVGLSRSFLGHK